MTAKREEDDKITCKSEATAERQARKWDCNNESAQNGEESIWYWGGGGKNNNFFSR